MNDLDMWNYLLEDSRRLASVEVLRIGVAYESWIRWKTVPPLPGNLTHTVSNPIDLIRTALQGMKNLREVSWDDVTYPRRFEEFGPHERAFWDLMPRVCHGVQVVNLSLPFWADADECWYCTPRLSELHRLNELRVFRANLLSCNHELQGLEDSQAKGIQSRLFATFSRIEELCLVLSRVPALPELHLPLLKELKLLGVEFEEPDGPLQLLKASPQLRSFHLETRELGTNAPYFEIMGVASGSGVVPLLESFTGCWEDLLFLGFNPLTDGTFRKLSQVNILNSDRNDRGDSGELTVDVVSKVLTDFHHEIGINLRYLAISMTVQRPESSRTQEPDLLWATWLSRIAMACPRLRGLVINAEDDRTAPEEFRDETDGWKSILSHLQELVVLQLPHVIWQADVDDAGTMGAALRLAAEQCVEWLPKIRLLFTPGKLALVVNDVCDAEIILEGGKLLDHGRTMARTWSLHADAPVKGLHGIVAELIPLRITAEAAAWLASEGWP
ncbi:hypothetical protein FRC01_000505 [Tulasnella sp. 417]|nr:hypothetical protein FRC01_000505 [Tulasnella sp. 417]